MMIKSGAITRAPMITLERGPLAFKPGAQPREPGYIMNYDIIAHNPFSYFMGNRSPEPLCQISVPNIQTISGPRACGMLNKSLIQTTILKLVIQRSAQGLQHSGKSRNTASSEKLVHKSVKTSYDVNTHLKLEIDHVDRCIAFQSYDDIIF